MYRTFISTFFLIIFTALISAPTIITMVDDTIDVSVFFASSEEEEKEFKIVFSNENANESDMAFISNDNNLGYFYKNYPKPHLNLISPPPELHIL